ncbi:pcp [Symbiodinium natans]|uniref:Pcp protein n=1 Tax=Symbiodinium natans TaxID=878477 RepID=A0A812R9L8_9DINO|nr:pcp [Symbiodinium natans]
MLAKIQALQALVGAVWMNGATGAILLTGYNPWANFTQNPSGEVAAALNGSIVERLMVHSIRVDVNEAGVLQAQEMVQQSGWDAIVHLGFEDEAKGLKLETMAANKRALHKGKVASAGPELLPTTGDLGAVALNTNNPHELWSRDAGDFFCNEIYYRTLYSVREHRRLRCPGALIPSIFIHVPPLHKMPLQESVTFVRSLLADLIKASGCPAAQPARAVDGLRRWLQIYG